METILEVKNLSKIFKEKKRDVYVVKNVSFSLNKGEILGLVGESGSGKSTIAKLITRLIDSNEGTIVLDGKDITNVKGKELREAYSKIQMVFQNPVGSFNPRKTLGYGIGESLKNKGISSNELKTRVEELLVLCGLTKEFANRYPHEVSGGQCQRAAIARALACEPDILIFDEATSALDVTVQKQIMDLLVTLQREKCLSYIFICHNLALVQQFCDNVIVLYDGQIVESGKTDDVIMHPMSEYAAKLVNAIFE